MNNYLEKVKKRLGLKDDIQNEQLESIIENVESELQAMLPGRIIPDSLNFIVIEISTKRYNRIGAEGMSSETVEGRSSAYEAKDFEPYEDLLNKLYPKDKVFKGSVQFF